MQYDDVTTNPIRRTAAILKIDFWLYLRDLLFDYRKILCEEVESRSDTAYVTKIPDFENSRCRTAAILKMVLSLYVSRKSSDFDEIWCADSNFGSKIGHLLIYKNMAFKMADSRHIENRLLATSARVIVRLTRYLVCTSRTML